MRISKFGPYITQLTRFGLMNSYIVETNNELYLVDTNVSGSADQILQAAASIGKRVTKILITHGHSDHVGSVDDLMAALPSAELITSERTAAYMRGDFTLPAGDTGTVGKSNFPKLETVPSTIVKPGDKIGPLLVIGSPGHTRDHISFLDERDKSLFCGDSWQSAGGVAVMGDTRWLFPLPAMVTWDRAVSVESAAETMSHQPNRLCSGHGRVIENANSIMQAAYERAKRKISS